MVTWTENAPPVLSTPAARAYVLCTTPRSGSTLLCGMLADAGAGWPASYYHRAAGMAARARDLGVTATPGDEAFGAAYLAAIRRAGSAGTAIFGMRLMWDYAPYLFAVLARLYPGRADDRARMEAAFGTTRFVHLTRQDKVAQAVSLHKAQATGLWHRARDGSIIEAKAPAPKAGYDAKALAGYLRDVTRADAAWTDWFAAQAIAPYRITYETLAADPVRALRGVLVALDMESAHTAQVAPATARLADPESATWAKRFRAEPHTLHDP